VLVLRDRELAIGEREALGRALAAAAQASEQRFVVAVARDAPRPFALAAALGASGVHLPAGGPLPSAARAAGFSWVSRAHHDLEELAPLERAALSALFVSPAFAPRKGRLALGEQGLRARLELLARLAPGVQLLALGGVDAASAPLALRAGAQGVAVIGAAHDSAAQRLLLLRLGLER
jgi:thiamine monophosphate synthase